MNSLQVNLNEIRRNNFHFFWFVQFQNVYLLIFSYSESINKKKNAYVQRVSGHEFSVAHYTGKVTYDCRDMADKNRDFLPPEMVRDSSFLKRPFNA